MKRRRESWWLRNRQGFTLTEALIVIILLGITATMALPAMERGVSRSKADRAGQAIANELRNAFSLAARQRKPVTITLNTTNRTITMVDYATSAVIQQRDFSNQRSAFGLTSMSGTSSSVTVFPTGMASDSLRISFDVGPNQRIVRMTRVGHTRVLQP